MKVLFVIDNLSSGGAQRQMVTLAKGLRKKGHHIEFFLYMPGDHFAQQLEDEGITIHCHFKQSRYSLDIFLSLRKVIKSSNCHVILSFLTTPNFYNIFVSRTLINRPYIIVSERFCDPPEGVSLKESIVRQFYRWADFVTTNSHHQRQNFLKRYPWLQNKIKTIYNGLDTDYFSPSQVKLPEETFRLLSIGSIVEYKNIDLLIDALAILRDEHQIYAHLDWVGRILKTEYYEHLEEKISFLDLTAQWNWLYQRHDIPDLLRQHHALIHPSYFEGLPNVVCEALACGRPVIASNLLDHPKLVQNGKSGYLFDPQNSSDLANCIKQMYELSSSDRCKIGETGRAFALSNLSVEKLTENYELLFEQLLGTRTEQTN